MSANQFTISGTVDSTTKPNTAGVGYVHILCGKHKVTIPLASNKAKLLRDITRGTHVTFKGVVRTQQTYANNTMWYNPRLYVTSVSIDADEDDADYGMFPGDADYGMFPND